MLCDNGDEPFQASEDGPMDHDRSCWRFVFIGVTLIRGTVLQIEPFRKLEIELDCGALEGPAQRITDGYVNLWPIECTIPGIDIPFTWILLFEGSLELLVKWRKASIVCL